MITDALQLIRTDHQKVKELFREFEHTEERAAKQRIVNTALKELEVHARLEEELFYPAVKQNKDAAEIIAEAHEEHHVVKVLMGELEQMRPSDEHYDAKFKVLAENVEHHIEEEEQEIIPKLEALDMDLEQLGEEMTARKQELMLEVQEARRPGARSGSHQPKARGQRPAHRQHRKG